jgi:hypothetical protein
MFGILPLFRLILLAVCNIIFLCLIVVFIVPDFIATSIEAQAFSVYVDGKYLASNWDLTKSCCDIIKITVPVSFFLF